MTEHTVKHPGQLGDALMCDYYHLLMGQSWFHSDMADKFKSSEAFVRAAPFGGQYYIAAGQGPFLEFVKNWSFTDHDIDFLRQTGDFAEDFLQALQNSKLQIDVYAPNEGELMFPNQPAFRVSGPSWQVEMMEGALLNIFNSQSLIATKASRMKHAAAIDGANRPLIEMGLRRTQEMGGVYTARAAYIGGADFTSNVRAAQKWGITPKGTMSHAFVQSFNDELASFKAALKSSASTLLLIDTYDIRTGIHNAIAASRETGVPLYGTRIDSGDLAYWYHQQREIFGQAGMPDVKLCASNDLDEHTITDLVAVQGAKYDMFGAGTKLITAYDQPSLGGVFKTKYFDGVDKIKIADGKTTIPGVTNVVRILNDDGTYAGDIIVPRTTGWVDSGALLQRITSVGSESAVMFEKGTKAYSLLHQVVHNGRVLAKDKPLADVKAFAHKSLGRLDPAYKRFMNSHRYRVGIEESLYQKQQQMKKQGGKHESSR